MITSSASPFHPWDKMKQSQSTEYTDNKRAWEMYVMMLFLKYYLYQVWWCMLLVPEHGSQRWECLCGFKASLANIEFPGSPSCPERLGLKQRHKKKVRQWTLGKDTRCYFSASAWAQGHANTRTNAYASTAHMLVQDDPQCKGYFTCHIRIPLWVDGTPTGCRTTYPSSEVWNRGKEQGIAQGNLWGQQSKGLAEHKPNHRN